MVRDKDLIIKDIMHQSAELERLNHKISMVKEQIQELSLEGLSLDKKRETAVNELNELLAELVEE